MTDDPYCWPGSSCLTNHLGIKDPEELELVEARVAAVRDAELARTFLPGAYDRKHLQRFHRELFGDVYPWAGELRTVGLSKGHPFCLPPFIVEQLDTQFAALARNRYLLDLPRDAFVARFAELYGEINAIHPFREGNGRAQRAFLRQLAAAAGWSVSWEGLGKQANDEACHRYRHHFERAELIELLEPVIVLLPSHA